MTRDLQPRRTASVPADTELCRLQDCDRLLSMTDAARVECTHVSLRYQVEPQILNSAPAHLLSSIAHP